MASATEWAKAEFEERRALRREQGRQAEQDDDLRSALGVKPEADEGQADARSAKGGGRGDPFRAQGLATRGGLGAGAPPPTTHPTMGG